jgi:hypothetical protein
MIVPTATVASEFARLLPEAVAGLKDSLIAHGGHGGPHPAQEEDK